MILNDIQIRELITKKRLVTNCVDLEEQLQSHGIDLTVHKVFEYKVGEAPRIDFWNKLRRLPEYVSLPRDLDETGLFWPLKEGTYLVQFNEIITLPTYMIAIGIHRSTVIRCDCNTAMGYWDAGYSGRGITRLEVGKNGLKLYLNAKISQLIFMTVDEALNPYNGKYQNENKYKKIRKKNRTREGMRFSVLKELSLEEDGLIFSHIMHKANVKHPVLKEIMFNLMSRAFVEMKKDWKTKRTIYCITEKGKTFIDESSRGNAK